MATILTLHNLLLAAGLGGLIGLERERVLHLTTALTKKKNGGRSFAGIRTFMLVSLLGLTGAGLAQSFGSSALFLIFGAFVLLLLAAYSFASFRQGEGSILTELDALLTFFVGVLVGSGETKIAVTLAVLVILISALRTPLHHFVETVQEHEFFSTLKFAAIAILILPLLPDVNYDAQIFQFLNLTNETLATGFAVFNPYKIWFLVVVVSAISFIGYFLTKFFGTKGLELSGAIGGIYSSTTTCLSLAEKSQTEKQAPNHFLAAFFFAYAAMLPRVLSELSLLNQEFFETVLRPLILLLLVIAAIGFWWHQAASRTVKPTHTVPAGNPFQLISAIKMALFVVIAILLAKLVLTYLDPHWIFVLAFVLGLTKMDPLVVMLAALVGTEIELATGLTALAIGITANGLQKTATLYFFGNRKLVQPWLAGISIIAVATFGIVKFF
jgi:uncharacterized membrane protein (DUF4010 family)